MIYDEEYNSFSDEEEFHDIENTTKKCIKKYGDQETILITARKLIVEGKLGIWCCQRDIIETHLNKIAKSYKDSPPCVITGIHIVCNKKGEYVCIDGQHRILALKMNIENDSRFDTDLIVQIYYYEHDSEIIIEKFKELNDVQKIEPNEIKESLIKESSQKILSQLIEHYGDNIFKDVPVNKRCNRPNIDKRKMIKTLNEIVDFYPKETIFKCILVWNNKMGTMSSTELQRKFGRMSERIIQKAQKCGCFIGLENPSSWVELIKNEMKELNKETLEIIYPKLGKIIFSK